MNLAAGFDVVEARGLEQRRAAAGLVVEPLFVLLEGEAAHEDVRIRGAQAHGRQREDREAHEHFDEGEAAASHLASMAGKGAQVRGSMGTRRRSSLRRMSRRTRSHVPSG